MSTDSSPAEEPETSPEETSIFSRMMNVFAAPGETFDGIRHSPPDTGNWLMPAILLMIVGWIGSFLILSQPEIMQQIHAMAEQGLQQQIDAGKLTEAQAEGAREQAHKMAEIGSKVSGVLGAPLVAFATPFWWGLLLWLLGGKLLKGGFSFMKAVEVAGLSSMILVLESVVKTLLILATGNLFAGPGPVLFIEEFNQQNVVHGILAKLSIITFWVLAVRSIGISRLGAGSFAKCAGVVFGFWALWQAFWTGVGYAVASVFQP